MPIETDPERRGDPTQEGAQDLPQDPNQGPNQESVWVRGLFMLLFVVIYGVAEVVVLAVAVIQFGWLAMTEERNERLQHFAASLSEFIFEIVRFWTFVSDDKPFPFADWPDLRAGEDSR